MSQFLIDTSCIIAHLTAWHGYHEAAFNELERRVNRGEELIMAAPALMESYSVLTRLPQPRRLAPAIARNLLEENFGTAELIALDGDAYRHLLRTAPERDISGGRIYDAAILACALRSGANALLTFNERHFRALAKSEIEIVVPTVG